MSRTQTTRSRSASRRHALGAALLFAGVIAFSLTISLGDAGGRIEGSIVESNVAWRTAVDAVDSRRSKPRRRDFRAVSGLVERFERDLGRSPSQQLQLRLGTALAQLVSGKECLSVQTLGNAAAGVPLRGRSADAGRSVQRELGVLQERILLATKSSEKMCGLPPLPAVIEPTLRPQRASTASRPLARVSAGGSRADFVANELVVRADHRRDVAALARRWGGMIVADTGPPRGARTYLVRIDPSRADAEGLGASLRRVSPTAHGKLKVSSGAGYGVIAAAAAESARDGGRLAVGLNWISEASTHFLDGTVAEGGPTGNANPFDWSYMTEKGPQAIGAAKAWRDLELAGKLDNKVRIAIIDGGFRATGDYPSGTKGELGAKNTRLCSGNPCDWHGTGVALTAGGVVGNDVGTAGSGGPVAQLTLISDAASLGGVAGDIESFFDDIAGVYAAMAADARVVNMSFGIEVPTVLSFAALPFEIATATASASNMILFAGAGNSNEYVDNEDCLPYLTPIGVVVVCSETTWWAPCENIGVTCVGGIAKNSKHRAANSNYGESVDIFGPYTVFAPDSDTTSNVPVEVSGTSVASPFVAGVAALVWAAKPSLPAFLVENLLKTTGHTSPNKWVYRYVNARAAVQAALDPVAPFVQITSPLAGATIPYGGLNSVKLTAAAFDVEDGDDCCTLAWTVQPGGAIGTGPTLDHVFAGPAGLVTITATATDADGQKGSASIQVTRTNSVPLVKILSPSPGAKLTRGVTYALVGSATDLESGPGALPCSSLQWKSSAALDSFSPTSVGCTPILVPKTDGLRVLTLTATDSQGTQGTAKIKVTVVAPSGSRPSLSIVSPILDARIPPDSATTLRASAAGGGPGRTVFRWFVLYAGQKISIGEGITRQWTPTSSGLPASRCGDLLSVTLRVENGNGSASTNQRIFIGYPPC